MASNTRSKLKVASSEHTALLAVLSFFLKNQQALFQNQIKFTLNPGCLRVMTARLQTLETSLSQQSRHSGSTYFNRTEEDQDFIAKITALLEFVHSTQVIRIESNVPRTLDKSSRVDLSLFHSLRRLELSYVKPSIIDNLGQLQHHLQCVVISHALNSISELLEHSSPPSPWKNLTELKLPYNNIPGADGSLAYSPYVQVLDLSHNIISKLGNFSHCFDLISLNLSFNNITSVLNANTMIGGIRQLILRQNNISSTEGLEKLYALEFLDLAQNTISSMAEVRRLSGLPCLSSLWLAGNPLAWDENYRVAVLVLFPLEVDCRPFVLDSTPSSSSEIKAQRDHVQSLDLSRKARASEDLAVPASSFRSNSTVLNLPRSFGGGFTPPTRMSSSFDPSMAAVEVISTQKNSKKKKKKKKPRKQLAQIKRVPLITTESSSQLALPNLRQPSALSISPSSFHSPSTPSPLSSSPSSSFSSSSSSSTSASSYSTSILASSSRSTPSPSMINGDLEDEEKDSLQQKLEEMRKEGGDSWLLVYNEWVEQNAPAPTPQKKNKKNRESAMLPNAPKLHRSKSPSKARAPASNLSPKPTHQHLQVPSSDHFPASDLPGILPSRSTSSSPNTINNNNNLNNNNNNTDKNDTSSTFPSTVSDGLSSTDKYLAKKRMPDRSLVSVMILLSGDNLIEAFETGARSNYPLKSILSVREIYPSDNDTLTFLQIEFSSSGPVPQLVQYHLADDEIHAQLLQRLHQAQMAIEEHTKASCPSCGAAIEGFRVTCPKCFNLITPIASSHSTESSTLTLSPSSSSSTNSTSTFSSYAMTPSTTSSLSLTSTYSTGPSLAPSILVQPVTSGPMSNFSNITLSPAINIERTPTPNISIPQPLPGGSPIDSLATLSSSMSNSITSHGSSFVDRLYTRGDFKTDITDVPPEVYSGDIDENLLIHLQVRFLHANGQHEEFVCLIRTSFLPFKAPLSAEKSGFLLLSVSTIYILQRMRKPSPTSSRDEYDFQLVAQLPLDSLRAIISGLFMQFFRLEFSTNTSKSAYVILPRSHARSHRFLSTLSRLSLLKIVNYNQLTLQNMQLTLLHNHKLVINLVKHEQLSAEPSLPPISCAVSGFLRTRTVDPREKGFYSVQHGNLVPRTLVMTHQWLFLTIEDYGNYPLSPQVRPPPTPQFTLVAHDSIHNIQAVEVDKDDPRTLTIVFEDEKTADTNTWNLLMQSKEQKDYSVRMISNLYQNIFQCPIITLTKE